MADHYDELGNHLTSLGANIAGEDIDNDVLKVEQRYLSQNIISATTTTITAKFLHSITVNTTAAGGTIIIKDGSTIIGTIKASVLEGTFTYNVGIANATIEIVTGAAFNITVSYR